MLEIASQVTVLPFVFAFAAILGSTDGFNRLDNIVITSLQLAHALE
jgi:hypothetical protein